MQVLQSLQLTKANFNLLKTYLERLAAQNGQHQPLSVMRTILALWSGAASEVKPDLLAFLPRNENTSPKFIIITINQTLIYASQADSAAVLTLFQHLGLQPDEYTYTTLLAKTATGATGKHVRETLWQQMQAAGITPNIVTYTTLLEKADSKHERETLLKKMQAAGVTPSYLMTELKFEPVVHDHPTFLQKARQQPSFQEAYDELEIEYALANAMLQPRGSGRMPVGITFDAQ